MRITITDWDGVRNNKLAHALAPLEVRQTFGVVRGVAQHLRRGRREGVRGERRRRFETFHDLGELDGAAFGEAVGEIALVQRLEAGGKAARQRDLALDQDLGGAGDATAADAPRDVDVFVDLVRLGPDRHRAGPVLVDFEGDGGVLEDARVDRSGARLAEDLRLVLVPDLDCGFRCQPTDLKRDLDILGVPGV